MRPLDIVVCIKPVPDPKQWNKLKLDPETMLLRRARSRRSQPARPERHRAGGRARRAGTAGSVSAMTMAPPDADDQLTEALAMGCDRALPAVRSRRSPAPTRSPPPACLAAAIGSSARFDLVFCGAYSLDGSTSQVGPQVAELLGIPDLTHAIALEVADTWRVAPLPGRGRRSRLRVRPAGARHLRPRGQHAATADDDGHHAGGADADRRAWIGGGSGPRPRGASA